MRDICDDERRELESAAQQQREAYALRKQEILSELTDLENKQAKAAEMLKDELTKIDIVKNQRIAAEVEAKQRLNQPTFMPEERISALHEQQKDDINKSYEIPESTKDTAAAALQLESQAAEVDDILPEISPSLEAFHATCSEHEPEFLERAKDFLVRSRHQLCQGSVDFEDLLGKVNCSKRETERPTAINKATLAHPAVSVLSEVGLLLDDDFSDISLYSENSDAVFFRPEGSSHSCTTSKMNSRHLSSQSTRRFGESFKIKERSEKFERMIENFKLSRTQKPVGLRGAKTSRDAQIVSPVIRSNAIYLDLDTNGHIILT